MLTNVQPGTPIEQTGDIATYNESSHALLRMLTIYAAEKAGEATGYDLDANREIYLAAKMVLAGRSKAKVWELVDPDPRDSALLRSIESSTADTVGP